MLLFGSLVDQRRSAALFACMGVQLLVVSIGPWLAVLSFWWQGRGERAGVGLSREPG